MARPCSTDHGMLTGNFCPECGGSMRPMREPGEVRAEYERFTASVRAAGRCGGVGGVVFVLAVTQTLAWVLNREDSEAPTAIFLDMTSGRAPR